MKLYRGDNMYRVYNNSRQAIPVLVEVSTGLEQVNIPPRQLGGFIDVETLSKQIKNLAADGRSLLKIEELKVVGK